VGSGLILLVIVGAWLAFFVQLALRSNETTNVLGTVDKFHDAMRVLSRRQAGPRGRDEAAHGTPAPGPGLDPGPGTPAPVPTTRRTAAVASSSVLPGNSTAADPARRRAEAAARRTRVLTGLAVAAVLTLVGAATLTPWLLLPHLLIDLLLVGLVVHLRALALGRAAAEQRVAQALARERAAQRATSRATTATTTTTTRTASAARPPAGSVEVRRPVPVVRRPVQIHVAGVPDRMPARPRPLPASLPVPAARRELAPEAPVRGAQGESWSPVPIPVPTYLSAPTAPRRVVDLTRSGTYPERRPSSEPEVGLHDVAPVQPAVEREVEQRLAVND
jgi:hypothetical protein